MADPTLPANNPQMGDDFAAVYAVLDQADRERVRAAIRTFVAARSVGETIEFRTPVLVAIGYRI